MWVTQAKICQENLYPNFVWLSVMPNLSHMWPLFRETASLGRAWQHNQPIYFMFCHPLPLDWKIPSSTVCLVESLLPLNDPVSKGGNQTFSVELGPFWRRRTKFRETYFCSKMHLGTIVVRCEHFRSVLKFCGDWFWRSRGNPVLGISLKIYIFNGTLIGKLENALYNLDQWYFWGAISI